MEGPSIKSVRWEGVEVTVLDKVVSEGLTRKVTFEGRPKGCEGINHVGKGNRKGKGPEVAF